MRDREIEREKERTMERVRAKMRIDTKGQQPKKHFQEWSGSNNSNNKNNKKKMKRYFYKLNTQ